MTPGAIWLAAALVLGLAELAAPGIFLIFVAAAAAMTALTLLAAPALPLAGQVASLALWSAVSVLIGRRWYRDYPVEGDARLNAPAARLVGCEVVAEAAFAGGTGRVRVGDGSWPARGTDAVAGQRLRVTAVKDGVLVVDAVTSPPSGG
jgi:hypothetical protein